VIKGERVMLVYHGERIQVAVKAEALSDADVGQMVTVRNLQTKKEILATVIDAHTVAVR
jgi:Flagellar basal body P-ring biosynthesis protein